MRRLRPGDFIRYNGDFSFGFVGLVVGFKKTSAKMRNFMSVWGEVDILTSERGVVSISLVEDDMVEKIFSAMT